MITVEYEDQRIEVPKDKRFVIGREGDLTMGGNPYLHRAFLVVAYEGGFWWLSNVGNTLSATVADPSSRLEAWLRPGARMPLVFGRVEVMFTAGPLSYDLALVNEEPVWKDNAETASAVSARSGDTTVGVGTWTMAQRMAIIALAEPMLRRESPYGFATLPSNTEAAKRLGWPVKRFEKKIDNICSKLDMLGVDGVRGGVTEHASSRRSRLVEWAISTGLATPADIDLLKNSASVTDDDE